MTSSGAEAPGAHAMTGSGIDVVALGSLHLDVMVRARALPRLGETMAGDAVAFEAGGKGGNQAVAAAQHGARVAMIGAIGHDVFGGMLRTYLSTNGVDMSQVAEHDGVASGMSVAVTEPAGDYAAIIVSGANAQLGALSPAASALIGGARWLMLQNEVPDAANLAAASAAFAAGCRVILNAAPARTAPPGLTAMVDVLVVNAVEAEDLSGIAVIDVASARAAATALCREVACAIVTAGGDGLALARHGACTRFPAHKVVVLSTHGAGDAFVGALAARLATGDGIEVAARYANAAAALWVATPVAMRGAIKPADVARLLAEALPAALDHTDAAAALAVSTTALSADQPGPATVARSLRQGS